MTYLQRLFILLVAVFSTCLSAFAASPPKAGCRPVSKLEYTISKKENVIISQGGIYVRTGPFWRRNYWHCPVKFARANNMAHWLVANVSVMDVHFQLWMPLAAGFILAWFVFRGLHATFAKVLKSSIFSTFSRHFRYAPFTG